MASSSAAAISAEERPKKYDVFISFRGEDTRRNFTSHLYDALRRKFVTHIDYEIERGDVISRALMSAIEESYVSLIIFSEDYASSKWCLEELTKIIECMKTKGQAVIPVFYKVDPSDVRKQLGRYKTAFVKHEQDRKPKKDQVLRWRTALAEAAGLAGFDCRNHGTEKDLIKEIVKDVQKKLNHVYRGSEFKDLVGFHQNCAHVERLLEINSDTTRIIGIWGIGGIGKTTLANALFEKYSSQYEYKCFLKNVRTESEKHGLDYLRHKLVCQLLGEDDHEICTPGTILSCVLRVLKSRKVFIVLDDISTLQQLEYCLVGKHECVGHGSRVILTTRDKHVFSGGVDGYHEVKKLNFNDSLQLFSLNAFKKSSPIMGYNELSIRAMNYAKGVPLALKVLGSSFLRFKSKEEWKSALKKLKKIPNKDIQSVLKLSYDELDDDEKEIFLDIAFFMKGWNENLVKRILDCCGFCADAGMRTFIDKALITISYRQKVEMHDLIQEMSWEIVRKKSLNDIGKRNRLRDLEEVDHILRYNLGTDAIQGIVLDKFDETGNLYLESDVFKKMVNLRFLILDVQRSEKFNLHVPSDIESLPNNLRYLRWSGYPLKSMPSTFCPEKLVVLDLRGSQVEKLWDGCLNLANLEEISLSGSPNLRELPDLSRAKKLERMYLGRCTCLQDVHSSILSLPKLEELILTDCKALKSLKSNVHSTSLSFIYAHGCSSLEEFLVTSENLRHLSLAFTAMDKLPPCVLVQKKLESLSFQVSESLNKLPDSLVQSLTILGCCQGDLSALCAVMDGLWYLKRLYLDNYALAELPENIDQLISLQYLSIDGGHCVRLPVNIKHLSQLEYLGLCGCKKLQSLPELPSSLKLLDASNCISLEILYGLGEPPIINALFVFENCFKLGQHALDTIMEDAYRRIRLAIEEQEEGNSDEEECTKIGFSLPGDKLPDWFSDPSTQPSLTIEIPSSSRVLGFVFGVIINLDGLDWFIGQLRCVCSLVGNNGETIISFESLFHDVSVPPKYYNGLMEPKSDHVYMWYDPCHCFEKMDVIEHYRTGYSMKLSFTFLFETFRIKRTPVETYIVSSIEKEDTKKRVMKSCGVLPIYLAEYHLAIREAMFPAPSSGKLKQD